MRGHDLAALRRMNTNAVLRSLRTQAQTLGQLSTSTGLSRPTVELLVEELVAQGLAEEAESVTGRSGRPARSFRFRGEAGHVVGVDIGLHKIVLLLSDLSGAVSAAEREDIDPRMSGPDRLAFLRARIDRFLVDHKVRQDDLWALAVGVPGVVDDSGRILSVVVPEWTDLDLARKLGSAFSCRILAENDVNLATLAEHWRGAAQLADDVACVLAGRRSSCGVLIDGRLHRGRRGGAGELGLLPQLGLARAQDVLIWEGERREGESEVEALARAAGEGDPAALEVLDRYAARLAPGVAALVLALDPELVVLSGGLTPAGGSLTPLLVRHLRDITLHVPRIAVSTLGEQGVALGAVRKALDCVDEALTQAPGALPPLPPPVR
ncbi:MULTISPECIES: ROK family protein [Streptomyces]|uniref:ROK family protein n=1 Tax=Streptomyces TaxID=1883 RepID=UPI001F3E12F1|nr:ROK family protein [Streptomyces lycii]